MTLAIELVLEVINAKIQHRALTDRHTDRQTNGTDSITSTADVGGNN